MSLLDVRQLSAKAASTVDKESRRIAQKASSVRLALQSIRSAPSVHSWEIVTTPTQEPKKLLARTAPVEMLASSRAALNLQLSVVLVITASKMQYPLPHHNLVLTSIVVRSCVMRASQKFMKRSALKVSTVSRAQRIPRPANQDNSVPRSVLVTTHSVSIAQRDTTARVSLLEVCAMQVMYAHFKLVL